MTAMIQALAAPDQPQATFAALDARVQEVVGAKLFTLMTLRRAERIVRRCYSNQPDAYPVSGEKVMQSNAWADLVIEGHQTFVANSAKEIAAVFPDHALIHALGCDSCINIPVVIGGQVVGTLNCLHEAEHYTPDRVAASELLKEPGALAFLLAAHLEQET